jgi:hypothetical protein
MFIDLKNRNSDYIIGTHYNHKLGSLFLDQRIQQGLIGKRA